MASFTVFANQRWTQGDYNSPTVNYNGAGEAVVYQLISSTWANDDPSIIITIQVVQSFDGGTTWGPVFGTQFSPGPLPTKNGIQSLPAGGFEVNDGQGPRLVRVQMTVSGTITFGLSAATTP